VVSPIESTQPPADPDTAEDERLLASVKVATDGPCLLEFFRKRILSEADQKRIAALIDQLGDGAFAVREKATTELIALGVPALGPLRRALEHDDAEVRRRVQACLTAIEKIATPDVEVSALRVLRVRRPEGACGVLLAYFPTVTEPALEEELLAALLDLGIKGTKVDPDLAAALTDKTAERRAAAAALLGRSGTPEQRLAVHKLLQDRDARVRLRAAQGLIAARDKQAVAALLPLLTEAPPDVARQAEDLLHGIAADKAPSEALGENEASRRKCRAAWEAWWKAQENQLDLARTDVDLPWLNANQRGRTVCKQFWTALMKKDLPGLKRLTHYPFSVEGNVIFKTKEELDKFLTDLVGSGDVPRMEMRIYRVVSLDEFARTAEGQQKEFVKTLPRGQVRAVYVTLEGARQKQPSRAAILVRFNGSRARVIGFGEVRTADKPGK
jgi:hypothetical protein